MITIKGLRLNHFNESKLDLTVEKGEILGLAGPNGAGKSTLLRYMAGLEPGFTEGKQQYFQPVPGIRSALAFQHAEDNLIFSNLLEDVRFGLRNRKGTMKDAEFKDLLKLLNMENAAEQPYREMSSGELERAALAGILTQKPDLLLLDEPLSSQSKYNAAAILERIFSWSKTEGTTAVIASHDPDLLKLCSRVIHLERGNIVPEKPQTQVPAAEKNPFNQLLQQCRFILTRETDLPGREMLTLSEYTHNASGKTCLRMDAVCFSHRNKDFFTNLSVSLKEGSLYRLSGPSGSGKSTLVKLMAGVLRADDGEITVFDKPFPRNGRHGWDRIGKVHHQNYLNSIRRCIGFAGQHADRQLFRNTVFEDVGFGPQNFGITGEDLQALQIKALYNMGIDESYWQRSPLQLSIGEQRKAAIAGVIAADPHILLLDDPYAELDLSGIAALNRLISDYLEQGKTVLIAEGR